MTNVVALYPNRYRVRAFIEHKQWPPEQKEKAPMRFIFSGYEIEEDDSIEWLTTLRAFSTYEECLTEALEWVDAPHTALVWDQVKDTVHDPSGKGIPDVD